jgi:hypothetical protein
MKALLVAPAVVASAVGAYAQVGTYPTEIDLGSKSGQFSISSAIGSSASAELTNLPTFNSYLGNPSITLLISPIFSSSGISYSTASLPLGQSAGNLLAYLNVNDSSYIDGAYDYHVPAQLGIYVTCFSTSGCGPISGQLFSGSDGLISYETDGTSTVGSTLPLSVTDSGSSSGGFSFSGNYTFSGTAAVHMTYQPFSTSQYVSEAISNSPQGGGTSTGFPAYIFLTALRQSSPITSSSNLFLRDAQYAVAGYNAGAELSLALSNENWAAARSAFLAANGAQSGTPATAPMSLEMYNALKVAGSLGCGWCAEKVEQVG